VTQTALLAGAGGTLGARIARLLGAAAPAVTVIAASRRGPVVLGAGARSLDVTRSAGSTAALEGVDLIVNAVGPYRYDPAPLVRACVGQRVHYVDLAESPAFVERVRSVATAEGAEAAGVAVVPGCSTVPGLVELLARPYFEAPGARSIAAWLSMGSANAVSGALLQGLLAPLGRLAPDGQRYFDRVETRHIGGRRLRFGRHPSGLVGTPLPVRFFAGFDRAPLVWALRTIAPALGRLSDPMIARLARAGAPLAALARPFGTPRGVLRVEALDEAGRVLAGVEVEARSEGLDVPAWPAVWATCRLLRPGSTASGGLSLADLVPRNDALAWLRGAGFEVSENPGIDLGPLP
jgi:hypothetical protein